MEILDPKLAKALERLTTGMTDADIQQLLYLMCVFEMKRNDVLIKEGAHTDSMYIVETGALRVTVGQGTAQVVLPEVVAGHWVGEIALLDPGPASATVAVVRPTVVLSFTHKALKDFAATHPAAACVLLNALACNLADRLHRTSEGLIQVRDGHVVQIEAPHPKHHDWFKEMIQVLLNPLAAVKR